MEPPVAAVRHRTIGDDSGRRVVCHGDGVIAEIRAYYIDDQVADSELADFPYAERGYLPHA